jgi:hypothetical protein
MPKRPAAGGVEAKRRALTAPSTAPDSNARWPSTFLPFSLAGVTSGTPVAVFSTCNRQGAPPRASPRSFCGRVGSMIMRVKLEVRPPAAPTAKA